MKNISYPQQVRRVTGEFLARQDNIAGNARQQQERVMALAHYPGRNSSNANQQNLAHSMLNLISLLSTVRPDPGFINSTDMTNTPSRQNILRQEDVIPYTPAESFVDRVTITELVNPHKPLSPPGNKHPNIASRAGHSGHLAAKAPNSNITHPLEESEIQPEPVLLIDKQNSMLDALLMARQLMPHSAHRFDRLNSLTDYIAESDGHVTEIARLLLAASNSYGAEKEETLTQAKIWAVIADYYNQVIFGMDIEIWLSQQIQKISKHENHLYHHENIRRAFTNILNGYDDGVTLSPAARKFYQENILQNILPTFMLQLDTKEQTELAHMDVCKTEWGFIHAGAKVLNYFANDISALKLAELAEVGVTLDILLRQGAIAQEYAELFFLPALFYHAKSSRQPVSDHKLSEREIVQLLQQRFVHTDLWLKQHNPAALLPDLMNQWKTRHDLAREILDENNIPHSFLNTYLNKHMASSYYFPDGQSVNIPNIDELFERQNEKIEKTAFEAEKLILPAAFNAASEDSQAFIANARVNRVRARFSAEKALQGIPLHPSAKQGMKHAGGLESYIPDQYDLLQCINNNEERIYILQVQPNGQYRLTHANSLRKDLFWLLDDIPPGTFDDYELKFTVDRKLKDKTEPPAKIVHKLATLHSHKLKNALAERGYQKTLDDKVRDFLLSLIPFYSCINESIQGNREAAISACLLDVISMVPFAGAAVNSGLRFGSALTKSTALALSWSARQATLKNMLKQAGTTFVNQFPHIAAEISPRVMQNLGVMFLRSIDPGVELLTKGTVKGAQALEKVLAKLPQKGRGLTRLENALSRISGTSLPEAVAGKYQTRTLFSAAHGRELELAAIGKQDGRQVWVQFDSETGELFGRKYFINDQDIPEPIPFSLSTRLKLLRKEGFGGKGALRKKWSNDDQVAGPSNDNRKDLPVIKTEVINNIAMQISTFGEPGSEALLYPEVNRIARRRLPINVAHYRQSLATLSPVEQAAIIEWMKPGAPVLSHSDDQYEMVNNLSIDLNAKLAQGLPLTPYEQFTFESLLHAINSKKIPGIPGDYLHVTHYQIGSINPWLNGAFSIGDYVTNFPMILSLSSEPDFAVATINEASISNRYIDSFIIYQVENAQNIFPMLSSALNFPGMENDFIYPPRTILKVKSISVSQPVFPEKLTGVREFYKAKRIGVILTEVEGAELDQVMMVKNIFNADKIPIATPRSLLPACNVVPSLPMHRKYWDSIRDAITAPPIPLTPDMSYTTIQKLEKFIPELPIQVAKDTDIITKKIESHIGQYLRQTPWRAYIGLSGSVPAEIAWLQGIIRHHCEESLRSLTHADDILSDIPEDEIINSDIAKYISGLTPTDDPAIINEVFQRITKVFKRARIFMEAAKKIDYSNFIIVSTDLFPVSDARQKYISLLNDEDLSRLPKACTHKFDPDSRIMIFADQFLGNSPDGRGLRLSLSSSSEFKMHQTITHETTHLTSLSSDLFTHAISDRAAAYSALHARHNFIRALTPSDTPQKTAPIWQRPDFVSFMQNVINYQRINKKLDYADVITMINNDPMLAANIFYSDAEVLALIANDIDAQRSFDALLRTKRNAPTDNNSEKRNIYDALLFLSFLLDATNNGLIHLNTQQAENEKIRAPLKSLKRKTINGVTMDLQIYGATDNAESLFPEKHAWENNNGSPAKKSLRKVISTLSQQEKKALSLWPEFTDQHPAHHQMITPTINEKLIKGIALNAEETRHYTHALSAIHNGKLPGVSGDFLRVVHYKGGEKNPWLNDELDINDYLTTAKAFMSVSSDTKFALSEIAGLGNAAEKIASVVFYTFENATGALPVLPLAHAPLNSYNEYLYPPDTLFRVKSLAISVPALTQAGYNNSDLYRAQRVAVTLTEVSPQEAEKITTLKNIFDGSATHFLTPGGEDLHKQPATASQA